MGNVKRLISLFVAVVLVFGCVSTSFTVDVDALEIQYIRSHTQNQSHLFSKDFTLTGNYADDVVAVASAQIGKTEKELMYVEAWCADFANDAARLTKMPDTIVPYNYGMRASCAFMYRYMINNCNAKIVEDVNDVRSGDYVFYYCPSSNYYLHVGIVASPDYYIEGNFNDKVQLLPFGYKFDCYMHYGYGNNSDTGHVKRIYVRPDYPEPPKNGYTYTNPDKYSAPTRTLVYKEPVATSGYDVSWTQAVLYNLGYLSAVTGEYNKDTVAAVKKFQFDKKLDSTGEVDERTVEVLNDAWEEVKYPSYTNFKSSKSVYNFNDNINISAKISNADSYSLVIKNSGGTVVKTFSNTANCKFPASDIGSGAYIAYFTLTNSYKSLTSKSISFTVDKPNPTAAKLTVKSGTDFEATELSWSKTDYTVSYDLYIKNAKNNSDYIVQTDLTQNNFSALLPKGSYTAYVVSQNNYSSTNSEKISFTVKSGSPVDWGDSFYARFNLSEKNSISLDGSGEKAALQKSVGSFAQAWYAVKSTDNTYTLKNCSSGKRLALGTDGSIVLANEKNSSAQKWYIAKGKEGYYLIPLSDSSKVVYQYNNNLSLRISSNGAVETFKITQTSPVHNYDITELVAPNCTENGHVDYYCSICGKHVHKDLAAEGHSYVEEKFGKGHSRFTCKYCGDSYEVGNPQKSEQTVTIETADTPDTPDSGAVSNDGEKNTAAAKDIKSIPVIIGDIDGDGYLTSYDALLVNRASIGLEKLNDLGMVIADVDCDGVVTSADSLYILREVVRLHTESKAGDVIFVQSELDSIRFMKDDEGEKKK